MDYLELALERLSSQCLINSKISSPPEILARMVAVQAQDYPGGKWSLGLRIPGYTESQIESAISEHKIVRSWVMRGTLHFVGAADILWLLDLVGEHILSGNKRRYGELELDERILSNSSKLIVKALEASGPLTRRELLAVLDQNGFSTSGQRGVYMLQRASLEALICQGTVRANNPKFILLEGFPSKKLTRAQALEELAKRYFSSRGPATLQDFVWWSGLPVTEARRGLESVQSGLEQETIDGKTFWFQEPASPAARAKNASMLLPGFDEYLLAYKDRSASLRTPNYNRLTPANGLLPGTIVIGGQVIGTWKREFIKEKVFVSLNPFTPFTPMEQKTLPSAVRQLGEFLELQVELKDKSLS